MRQPARVFLGGEGPNDLGGWYDQTEYQSGRPGVIEALLCRLRQDGVLVVGAVPWKRIRKYKSGGHADAEQRNVAGLVLMAHEARAEVVAFCRDSDGSADRARSVEAGIVRASELYRDGPRIAGGVAVQAIEAWILALAGRTDAHTMNRVKLKAAIEALGLRAKGTEGYVGVVDSADLTSVPKDSSLHAWLGRAEQALGPA